MKKHEIIILLIASFLISCDSKPSKNSNTHDVNIKTDTLTIYQAIDLDTLRNNNTSYIGNDDSFLDIKTYSLNDSSIVFTDGLKRKIFHNYETTITIKQAGKIIQTATFNRDSFKDSLQEPFKSKSVLKSVKFYFIRSNCHYFDFVLETPNDQKKKKGGFMLFYRTKKKGIYYYSTDEADSLYIEKMRKLKKI